MTTTIDRGAEQGANDATAFGIPSLANSGERQAPILVPLDGSNLAERALPYGIAFAQEQSAPLLLVRVISAYGAPIASISAVAMSDVIVTAERDEAADYLARTADRVRAAAADLDVATELRLGDAALELLDVEAVYNARLVVLTTHGRTGLNRWLRGSVAEKVLRHGTAPVFLVRPWDRAPLGATVRHTAGLPAHAERRVLVALDGSSLAEQVLPAACGLAGGHLSDGAPGGEVVLAQVVTPGDPHAPASDASLAETRATAAAYLRRAAEQLRACAVDARPAVLVAPDPAGAIVDLAVNEEVDVIALSTHGRGGIGRWLYGSVADRIAHAAPVPVLLLRPARVAAAAPIREGLAATSR